MFELLGAWVNPRGKSNLRRRPDISRAFSTLMWRPRVGLREGIDRVIPYFKSQLGALQAGAAHASEMKVEGVSQAP